MAGTGKIIRIACGFFLCLLILGIGIFGGLCLYYRFPLAPAIAATLWTGLTIATIACFFTKHRRHALSAFGIATLALMLWWCSIPARSDRDWAPEVAHIATGEVMGSQVILHNVRYFNWRSPDDYDVKWESRTYDLDDVTGVDLFLSYWGMPAIAHTLIGFTFGDGERIVFSVEIRKEKGEEFSNIAGFFKQYELALLAADERDIIYLRTNIRGEDVYRYPLNIPAQARRQLFLSYLGEGQRITARPEFYNTVTANCTTIVFHLAQVINPGIPLDINVLLSGYLPRYLHKHGALYKGVPLEQMMKDARITAKARAGGMDGFSARVRN